MTESDRTRVGDRVTIYPRGKKRIYVADYWHEGEHRRTSLQTSNKKVALRKAMELDLTLQDGTFRKAPEPVSVREAADRYLDTLKTDGRARKTLVKYRGVFDRLTEWLKDQRAGRLSAFSVVLFDRYRARRREQVTRKTLYTEGVIIKQLFKWAHSRTLITADPLAGYGLEKPPLVPKAGPSLAEVDRILTSVDDPKKAIMALLAFTGMRSGELQRLRPSDIDLAGNWVHVVSRDGLETKTRASRKVPIHPRLRPMLEVLPASTKPWLFTMPPSRKYPDGDHWLNVKKLNEEFLSVLEGLGLPTGRNDGYTLHSLRHFFETFTVNARIPQRVVDAWLGHSGDKSMAAVYYRLSDEDSQAMMKEVPFGDGAEGVCEEEK